MWQATQRPPAPRGSWCECARAASSLASVVWHFVQTASPSWRLEARGALAIVGRVRVVAKRAVCTRRAAREHEVARLARADVAAARALVARRALPRPRVAREENLVAARARAVDLEARSSSESPRRVVKWTPAPCGASDVCTDVSLACSFDPPWHASQPIPTSTRSFAVKCSRVAPIARHATSSVDPPAGFSPVMRSISAPSASSSTLASSTVTRDRAATGKSGSTSSP